MITTASQLWEALQKKGGLNIKDKFYDQPIINDLINNLGLDNTFSFNNHLKTGKIQVERFLYAFFKAVEPYSLMMSDLLAFFEEVGVKHSNNNLEISFDFSKEKEELIFNLEHFKNWNSVWKKVSAKYLVNKWDSKNLWSINEIFRRYRQKDETKIDSGFKSWELEYRDKRIWPDNLPPLPREIPAKIGETISKVWGLVTEVYEQSSSYGKSRDILRAIAFNRNNENENKEGGYWDPELLGQIDTDLWINSLIAGVFGILDTLNDPEFHGKDDLIYAVNNRVESVYAKLDTEEVKQDTLVQQLEEFLDLPVWKQRHELYSVWVSTQIIGAIGLDKLDIHSDGDKLVFSFAGTHFASTRPSFTPLHLWAELRSPLTNPVSKKRKASIQPDYTILKNPFSSKESAILVVECKQYKKQSTKNFTEALLDYATARKHATVVLVNYGPVSTSFMDEEILADVRNRVVAIGDMRPNNPGSLDKFSKAVKKALPAEIWAPASATATTSIKAKQARVSLQWALKPSDLDLHVNIISGGKAPVEVSYANQGSRNEFPFCELITQDVQSGFGPEVIEVSQFIPGHYFFYVHKYSDDGSLTASDAFVELVFEHTRTKLECPKTGNGDFWHLFSYHSVENEWKIINEIREHAP